MDDLIPRCGIHDHRHADSAVEGPGHLAGRDTSALLQHCENGGKLPRRSVDDGVASSGQNPRNILNYSAAGDVREAVHGHIPSDIADRIDTHELDTSLLDVSLRGYQAFGARFALAQGRSPQEAVEVAAASGSRAMTRHGAARGGDSSF